MAKVKAAVEYKLSSFSTLPSQPEWQHSVQQGLLSIVLRSDKTTVTAVTMDVPKCLVRTYTHDEFREAFLPNLTVSRRLAAQQLKSMRFMGGIDPDVVNTLQAIIDDELDVRPPMDKSLFIYRSETGRHALARLDGDDHIFALTIEHGQVMERFLEREDFESVYTPIIGTCYTSNAAKIFESYAAASGDRLSPDARAFLNELINGKTRSTKMATNAAKKVEKKVTKPTTEAAEKRSSLAPAKSPAAVKAAKLTQAARPREPRESASKMFRELIMDGKLTDDQIFQKVQAKFGLGDEKRNYVKWYRNHLKKTGKNPPAAKAA